jgi:hypothetical protein
MQSTPNLTQTDPHADPHDHVLVARVAEELSELAHDAIGRPSDSQVNVSQAKVGSDFAAGPSVLSVDATFRAAAVNDGKVRGSRPSAGARAIRVIIGFLLAVCIGGAAFAWQTYGDAAKQMVAQWAPQLGLASSPPLQNSGLSEQTGPPAVQASAAKAAAAQTVDPAQPAGAIASNTAALPPEGAQSQQSLAADLANAGQEIAQLKASIVQLKASQEQMSRDIAKLSEAQASVAKTSEARTSEAKVSDARASEIRPAEQNLRPRASPPPRRVAAVPARRPMQPYYPPPSPAAYPAPQAVAAPPPLPQAVAPLVPPPQPEPPPLVTAQPDAEPVLRPPMPVR